jgi:hypothetical protein
LTEKIQVSIKYKDIEETFSGSTEETWLQLSKFYSTLIPSFDIAKRLQLNVDLKSLAKNVDGIIAFSKEGSNLLPPKSKLTDNESLILWLLASYLGHKLSLLENEAMSKEDLQAKLGKSGKITSTRLGELAKNDLVTRMPDEKFKITTLGVVQAQKEILPKVRAKTCG